jgi:hypothetical protein
MTIFDRPTSKIPGLGVRILRVDFWGLLTSEVRIRQHTSAYVSIRQRVEAANVAFYSQLKSKVGNILVKATVLRSNLNIDGAPIASHAHTHPPTHKPLTSYSLPSP